mgnify:FL=1
MFIAPGCMPWAPEFKILVLSCLLQNLLGLDRSWEIPTSEEHFDYEVEVSVYAKNLK